MSSFSSTIASSPSVVSLTERQYLCSLVALPPEILSIIARQLPKRKDLNSLSRASKRLKDVLFPILYNHVSIKAPTRWSRLPSIENLISSSEHGLQFTTEITIETQLDSLSKAQDGNDELSVCETGQDVNTRGLYTPENHTSSALNSLVGLLLSKIPQGRLGSFRWNHYCSIANPTLKLLIENHRDSLYDLWFNNLPCTLWVRDAACGLSTLYVDSLPFRTGFRWVCDLITLNRNTLRHLGLGLLNVMATAYSGRDAAEPYARDGDDDGDSNYDDNNREPTLELESLSLYGLEPDLAVQGLETPLLEFSSLRSLTLYSCPNIASALRFLLNARHSAATWQLQAFALRGETAGGQFRLDLEAFLCGLPGLKALGVLTEGSSVKQELMPILKVHGKSLRTLIWDERKATRRTTAETTSLTSLRQLDAISSSCPKLTSLGLSLDWHAITQNGHENRGRIFKHLTNMKKLETLNIRNMPEAKSPEDARSWLSLDQMYQAMATRFMELWISWLDPGSPCSLKTLGLGALTYADVCTGDYHASEPLRDFLRLRIYLVQHHMDAQGSRFPRLVQVVKGKSDDEVKAMFDLEIFNIYWLG